MSRRPEDFVYKKRKRRKIVVILDDLDFIWDEPELFKLAKMNNEGMSILEMAEAFERDPDEIFLALFHLARR